MSILIAIFNHVSRFSRQGGIVDRSREKLPNRHRFNNVIFIIKKHVEHSTQRIMMQKRLTICDRFRMGSFAITNATMSGDVILNKLMNCLNEFTLCDPPLQLRRNQQKIVCYAFASLLPQIYGPAIESERERLIKLLGVDKIREEIVILAPRREGKSFCVSMVAAAALICIPVTKGTIFSINWTASTRLVETIKDCISKHPVGQRMINSAVMDNVRNLKLQGDHPTHIKSLTSFIDNGTVCFLFFSFSFF